MLFIELTFSENKALAKDYMAAHNDWLQKSFDDGVFLMSGSLASGQGGVILAKGSLNELQARVASDPFVEHGIVRAELKEFSVGKCHSSLADLIDQGVSA